MSKHHGRQYEAKSHYFALVLNEEREWLGQRYWAQPNYTIFF